MGDEALLGETLNAFEEKTMASTGFSCGSLFLFCRKK